jgi:hypothetical protein
MPADEIVCRQSNLILAGIASWINCLAVEPGFEGFSEGNLEFVHLKGHFFGVWSNSVVRGTEFLRFGLTIRHI